MIFHFFDQANPSPLDRARKRGANYLAQRTYEQLRHSEGIIWLAEALEVTEPDELQRLADEALKLPRVGKRYAYLRDTIPWKLIFAKAQDQEFHGHLNAKLSLFLVIFILANA